MFDPISTYRIQFNKDFTFSDFKNIIPYLKELGIKTLYASPVFEAMPGSTHGYDGVNPNKINPEIGTLEELREISSLLKDSDMNWVQDIVPNHMGFYQSNTWLMDVLKKGEKSPYRKFFDITSPDLGEEPLMAPFLGDDLETVLQSGDLKLVEQGKEWFLEYFGTFWPLREDTDLDASIDTIATSQYYRLCNWKESSQRMNYRRFFTVNNLICMNMQNPEVFDAYHELTLMLVEEGVFQGLRIDHIDGLYDPRGYLEQLRAACGEEVYIVVEKILEPDEALPGEWPVQGTTGYDYLGLSNRLFVNAKNKAHFSSFYSELAEDTMAVHDQILEKKRAFLESAMQGELSNLVSLFKELGLQDYAGDMPFNENEFRKVIGEILVRCPIYRFYGNKLPLSDQEQTSLNEIFSTIEEEVEAGKSVALLRKVLSDSYEDDRESGSKVLRWYLRLMQFSGPLMAKGVEDTLMYTYNRFIGNNEVGDSPEEFGFDPEKFHQAMADRQVQWPLAMNGTSTHDTKRGEDARARLSVLTDLGAEWTSQVTDWQKSNDELKVENAPDFNDEYFIYQTLVATYPEEPKEQEGYQERLTAYIEKAFREAKRHTNWESPDAEYERRTKEFIVNMLDQKRPFWDSFSSFAEKVIAFGKINAVAALTLKFGVPGVPDTYQGTELWDLSMVDPDNRRPVDYNLRLQWLKDDEGKLSLQRLLNKDDQGKTKLSLLHALLKIRSKYPQVFAKGAYLPLKVEGALAERLFAFARKHRGEFLVFVLPLNLASSVEDMGGNSVDWQDTAIVLPDLKGSGLTNLLNEKEGLSGISLSSGVPVSDEGRVAVADLLAEFPAAVLHGKQAENDRGAGILLHISSLPGRYGIGDMGPSAHKFLSFLERAGQKYWQMLPLNPITKEQSFSPYSASSAMAGNILFISPELLAEDGLLTPDELDKHRLKSSRKVKYDRVETVKYDLLEKAYKRYLDQSPPEMVDSFDQFCKEESEWLGDFSLYTLLKELQNGKPWYEWPDEYRSRDARALGELSGKYAEKLAEIKWSQFIFYKQWLALRQRAKALDVELIGDIPFYAAHDSADVWANREYFNLNDDGSVAGIAGVPPDYFNAEGQLWGMPVFNWDTLKKDNYRWWVLRIKKNMELFDIVRLDHFRAFASYWEVAGGSETAIEGVWKDGPGEDIFNVLLENFGSLPFIAEDLGEITDDVYALRDKFSLPGMKVLQFAFGDDVGRSIHVPHQMKDGNCVVYTGTHDNNTTLGWFDSEADEETKERIAQYTGNQVRRKAINRIMIRLAYGSVANIAIVPMQDVLGKGGKSRMNMPASTTGNWAWRVKDKDFDDEVASNFKRLTELFGRN